MSIGQEKTDRCPQVQEQAAKELVVVGHCQPQTVTSLGLEIFFKILCRIRKLPQKQI